MHTTWLNPILVSSKYIKHGKKFESGALMEIEKFMFNRRTPVKVLPCGHVVSKGCPISGAPHDARVIESSCTDYFELQK